MQTALPTSLKSWTVAGVSEESRPEDPGADRAAAPALEDHFERGSALALVARGHPYDFVETYEILRAAYGYTSRSVNLGLWTEPSADDPEPSLDPGQRLVRALVDATGLADVNDILDVGSGLGQGSVDLARWFHHARVHGANINPRQLGFANALAAAEGVAERVHHLRADACGGLAPAWGPNAFDAAFAVECIGHFEEPARFLADLRTVLRPGGVFVCCMNVATAPLPLSLRTVLSATYGFVPRPIAAWRALIKDAGLETIEERDLTHPVLVEGIAHVRARLQRHEVQRAVPFAARALVRAQLEVAATAVRRGALGYALLVARRPR